MPIPAFFNWSGGKDSAFALFKALQDKTFDIRYLFTTLSAANNRISMHGVRAELLDAQSEAIGIDLIKCFLPEVVPMETYDKLIRQEMTQLKNAGIKNAFFGDIFLEDLRKYREGRMREVGINLHFPLWKEDTKQLIFDFLNAGFKTIVTCVSEKYLDESFVGRIVDKEFLSDLPNNVDPCGENGEYHSFVFDGPIFKNPIRFCMGEKIYKKYEDKNDPHLDAGFWYIDLVPDLS